MFGVDPKALLVACAIFAGAMALFFLFFVGVIAWGPLS